MSSSADLRKQYNIPDNVEIHRGIRGGFFYMGTNNRKIYISTLKKPKITKDHSPDTEFRKMYSDFKKCKRLDLQCILKSLGFNDVEHESILRLNCDVMCKLKRSDIPLGVVVEPTEHKAIGIQTIRGVVPIVETDVPKNKPVIKEMRKDLLSDIRNARYKLNENETSDIIQKIPSDNVVTIKPVPGTGNILAAIRRGTPLKKVSTESLPVVQDTNFLSNMLKNVRKNIAGTGEDNDDDDDEDNNDWD